MPSGVTSVGISNTTRSANAYPAQTTAPGCDPARNGCRNFESFQEWISVDVAFDVVPEPITTTGDFTYYAAFAGAAVSGEFEFGEKIVSPRVGIDYVYSPQSDVDITALNGAPTGGSLELSSLSGGRVFAEIEAAWNVYDGEARLGITPRIACYQSIQGLDGACEVGGSIELSSVGDETRLEYSVELDTEFGEGYDRGALSGSISRTLSVGTISGSTKFAPQGALSVSGVYELAF